MILGRMKRSYFEQKVVCSPYLKLFFNFSFYFLHFYILNILAIMRAKNCVLHLKVTLGQQTALGLGRHLAALPFEAYIAVVK